MAKIQTKTFNYGNEKESSWPPKYPKKATKRGTFHIDKKTGELTEGPPPIPSYIQIFGKAPAIQVDSMPLTSHPANGQPVESKSQFKRIMKAHGYEDRTGAKAVADNKPRLKQVSDDDYVKEVKIAREQVQAGTAPLTEYDKQVCKEMNRRLKNKA